MFLCVVQEMMDDTLDKDDVSDEADEEIDKGNFMTVSSVVCGCVCCWCVVRAALWIALLKLTGDQSLTS